MSQQDASAKRCPICGHTYRHKHTVIPERSDWYYPAGREMRADNKA